jgi:cysteine-rich repeat protein
VQDPGEVCDDGNNLSGDGCAAGCLEVEKPWECPQVGLCQLYCGNGVFDGSDPRINLVGPSKNEKCDDGNNADGDGCSSWCLVEDGYDCVQEFLGWKLEVPSFKSKCTKIVTPVAPVVDLVKQYFYDVKAEEYAFLEYSSLNATSGKLRLIEYPGDMSLFGVSLVARGTDTVTDPS